jgi:hypothetical protein
VRRTPTALATAAIALLLTVGATGCGGSSDEAATPTTAAPAETTATTEPSGDDATTSEPTPTTEEPADDTTTTGPSEPGDGLPPCQELLQQYADAFTPDDLQPVIDRFREWAPDMPEEVGVAVERLADAYEAADGSLGNLDLSDVDLSADAQTFSDWTNNGCPPG